MAQAARARIDCRRWRLPPGWRKSGTRSRAANKDSAGMALSLGQIREQGDVKRFTARSENEKTLVPRGRRLDRLRASLAAAGATVAFALHGGFRACLLAGPEHVPRHRSLPLLAPRSRLCRVLFHSQL